MASEPGASRRDMLKAGAVGFGALGGATLFPGVADAAGIDNPTDPAFRYFLKLAGIDGPSVFKKYEKWLEPTSWAWGVTNSGSAVGGGGGVGKSKAGDFIFAARSSIASPPIFLAVAKAKHLVSAKLVVVNGELVERFILQLGDVLATSYQQTVDPVDGFPIDLVHLEYAKLTTTVTVQKDDGTLGTPVTATFNFKTQT